MGLKVGIILLLLGLAVGGGGCAGGPRAESPRLPEGPVSLAYVGFDGQTRALEALRGRPVVVLVLATWAGPAIVEVERLRALRSGRGEAFALLILVLDEDPRMAAIFAETFRVQSEVGRVKDAKRLVGPEGPFGPLGVVPTSILLDAEGQIAVRSDGPWPEGVLEEALDTLLELR